MLVGSKFRISFGCVSKKSEDYVDALSGGFYFGGESVLGNFGRIWEILQLRRRKKSNNVI